ncbi:MAG TPA: GNAT family N-acetyltransferase [Streptosporangiaceae bacterium]|nr:GNAT family N-acetyltransferase [Streptosporangiaceae bacterium]
MAAEIELYHSRALPEALVWQSLSFMRCEWWLFAGEGRLRDQPFPAAMHLACTDGQVLLSYAEIVGASATRGSEQIPVAGLSNVFTFPPYRRAGFASKTVRAANAFLDARHPEMAILFCEAELVPFYAALGWTAAPTGTITLAGDVPHAMVRRPAANGAGLVTELLRAPLRVPAPW